MPFSLSRLLARRLASPVVRRKRPSLGMEALERRDVPATKFVVPSLVVADNTSTFYTLAAAFGSVAAGDTVQIQVGAQPGRITNADIPNLANLTVAGNPGASPKDMGAITIAGTVFFDSQTPNFTFRNVEILNFGYLAVEDKLSMDRVNFLNLSGSTAMTVIGNVAFSASTFTNNDQNPGTIGDMLIEISHGNGSGNRFIGNTFNVDSRNFGIRYTHTGIANVTDVISDNVFIGGNSTSLLFANQPLDNLQVLNNTFTGNVGGLTTQAAVDLTSDGFNVAVSRNTFSFSQNVTALKFSDAGSPFAFGLASVSNNRFSTNNLGIGLNLTLRGSDNFKVEGNDFNNNRIGAAFSRSCATADIDFGGGDEGSLGGNNFRSYTLTASATSGAIVTGGTGPLASTVNAKGNLFAASVANPETVIFDADDTTPTANINVDASNALTGTSSFVQSLYTQTLQRAGNLTNAGDAGFWVTSITNGASRSQVAGLVARSSEAYGLIVDKFYIDILGRQSDAGGRQAWIGALQGGATLEQVQAKFFASREFQFKTVSNAGFVASLYARLLGRDISEADLNGWSDKIAQRGANGRESVALEILGSAEYRGRIVRTYYTDLLHRSTLPSAAEIGAWVNSGADLYTIKVLFLGTAEFQNNG